MSGRVLRHGFDHLAQGTAEPVWQDGQLHTRLEPVGFAPDGGAILVLAAHPDDETLGAGGLVAAAAARGADVEIVVASDGAASHPSSSTHTPQQLAAIRREEVTAAVHALGPSVRLCFLGLPDGALSQHRDELSSAVCGRLGAVSLVVSPWRGDRHPDHEACAEAVRTALAGHAYVEHWQYPIWLWHWAEPSSSELPWSALRRLDLDDDALAAKHAAIACHVSQHAPLSELPGDEAILPEPILAHFLRAFEVFVVEAVHAAAAPGYFDELYERAADPWGLDERFYERRKRELIMAALPRPRFANAFEPGCAAGLLTELLAARCDALLAWDCAEAALTQARRRLAWAPHVRIERGRVPDDWPAAQFDLIVLSELGYYCRDLSALLARMDASLAPDGVVVACHWRHPAAEHPQSAGTVHDALSTAWQPVVHHVEEDFLLDVFSRTGESVARAEGILG